MKVLKIVSIILSFVLCSQCVVVTAKSSSTKDNALTSTAQPNGIYLMSG